MHSSERVWAILNSMRRSSKHRRCALSQSSKGSACTSNAQTCAQPARELHWARTSTHGQSLPLPLALVLRGSLDSAPTWEVRASWRSWHAGRTGSRRRPERSSSSRTPHAAQGSSAAPTTPPLACRSGITQRCRTPVWTTIKHGRHLVATALCSRQAVTCFYDLANKLA